MKKYLLVALLTTIFLQGFPQQGSAESQKGDKSVRTQKDNENTEITIGKNFLKIAETDSSVNVRIGNRGLEILESLEGPEIRIEKYERNDEWDQDEEEEYETIDKDCSYDWNDDADDRKARRRNRFRGNWAGLEIGFNNYTTSSENLVIPDDINYMSLHSGKSFNFNLNFTQLSLGITRHIGFVTGLGLNFNNYKFDGNNNIFKNDIGVIEVLIPGSDLKKSKFATTYLTLPFLLELQLPVNSNHLNIAAGPIGALKIGSRSKMITEDGRKIKTNSDYSLNMLRYGGTARVGISNFQLYATYYVTPLFQNGKGPGNYDLYPYEIGLAFTFND